MTREQKIAKARDLRAADVSNVDIARRLSVHATTVREWLIDVPYPLRDCHTCGERFLPAHGNQRNCCGENARKRRCAKERGRATCVDCGEPLGEGSYWRGCERCTICHRLSEAERVDGRARRIEQWWAEGRTLKEIAARVDWSLNQLSSEMHRLREKGYSLPYRYQLQNGPRFPKQVAA